MSAARPFPDVSDNLSVNWLWEKSGGFILPPEINFALKGNRFVCFDLTIEPRREGDSVCLPKTQRIDLQKRTHESDVNFTRKLLSCLEAHLRNRSIVSGVLRLWSTFQIRHQHDAYTGAPPWTITPPTPRGKCRLWCPDVCGLFFIQRRRIGSSQPAAATTAVTGDAWRPGDHSWGPHLPPCSGPWARPSPAPLGGPWWPSRGLLRCYNLPQHR